MRDQGLPLPHSSHQVASPPSSPLLVLSLLVLLPLTKQMPSHLPQTWTHLYLHLYYLYLQVSPGSALPPRAAPPCQMGWICPHH